MINLSEKARSTISFKDLGANEFWDIQKNSMDVQRNVAICADICGETTPIWFVETIGM